MRSYFRILLILLLSVLITVVISPIIASILPFPLDKVISRTALVVTFVLFCYFKESLGIQSIKSLGFSLNRRWWGRLGIGFAVAVASIGIIALIMLYTSIRYVIPEVSSIAWYQHLAGYLLAGFIVALIEETFFRGFILQGLLKDTHLAVSLVITNIFYSALHFLKPQNLPEPGILNLASSVKSIPLFFDPLFTEWGQIGPSFFGLFLVGLVLSVAYLRTRSLSLSIGLHAGWILGIKSLTLGTDVTSTGNLWVSGKIPGHPLSWVMMLVFLVLLGWPRKLRRKI